MDQSLDNPIWSALTGKQADLAQEIGEVRCYHPSFAPFAASAEGSPGSFARLSELVPQGGTVVLQQDSPLAPPPGLSLIRCAPTVRMVAGRITGPDAAFTVEELGSADAPDMLALARLTNPGPFAQRTHELGRFVGVRYRGALVAMAGERMKIEGFTEVSGVCTHPDHRGKGYAAGLISNVANAILAREETPFLHAFADNTGAIALYERLGFATRQRQVLMVLQKY